MGTIDFEMISSFKSDIENKNLIGIKKASKYFVAHKDWEHAYVSYEYLCLNDVSSDLYCIVMWSMALKTEKDSQIFDAAAINYNLNKSEYWLHKLSNITKSEKQKIILKLLQQKLLSDKEMQMLISSKIHYARALFIKGKHYFNLDSLTQASEIFITLKQWEFAADSLFIASNIALSQKEVIAAESFYYDALVYYDLAQTPLKMKELFTWGQSNGFAR